MRVVTVVSAVVSLLALACSDSSQQAVTGPDKGPRTLNVSVAAACDANIAAAVLEEINNLFAAGTVRNQAIHLWQPVVTDCPTNVDQARNGMLAYVQFTIDHLKLGNVLPPSPSGTPADAVVAHWNLTFPYVGYPAPGLGSDIFGPEGAAGVIPETIPGGQMELAAANAALTMYAQNAGGDQRGHLFTIAPIGGGCLSGTNLQQTGPCFEFSAFPKVAPQFSPKIKVGVCQPVDGDQAIPALNPALGHLTDSGYVEIPQQTAYPVFCEHVDEAPAISWNGGIRGVLKRVAWTARKVLLPEPLYAVHGGLGGLGGGISPFGAADLTVFEAGLHSEVLGNAPGTPDGGTWSSSVTKPGKIYSQLGLGTYTDTVIVINQAGGNCVACGGIKLQADLTDASGAGATSGVYDVSWVSIQDKPTVKDAPFVIRGSNGKIATLSYRSKTNRKELYYNGVLVGTWAQHVPQRFVVRIDLNAKRTSLWFGSLSATPAPATPSTPFIDAVTNLTSVAADFTDQDSGIVGWAELSVQRLVDQ